MISALADAVTALEPATLHMAEFPNPPQTPSATRENRSWSMTPCEYWRFARQRAPSRHSGEFGIHVELAWDRNLLLTSDVAGYLRDGISTGITYDGAIKETRDWRDYVVAHRQHWWPHDICPRRVGRGSIFGERITDAGHGKARAFGYGLASAVIDQWNNQLFTEEPDPRSKSSREKWNLASLTGCWR